MKRLGNRADAEDVLQEYCIRVLARKDQLRDIERMDAWLYAILRSTMNDHYRKTTRHSRLAVAVAREPQELVAMRRCRWRCHALVRAGCLPSFVPLMPN